jgi:molecular chaperone IbpA
MDVAGFAREELALEVNQNNLIVSANKQPEQQERTYLHQGIAARSFEWRFQLADHIQVLSADYENGLLHIALQKIIPESLKPRSVPIGVQTSQEKLTTVNAQNDSAAA